MSQQFLEKEFPLATHPDASKLRAFVVDSLYGENANPFAANKWADDAVIYTRSDWSYISDMLADEKIALSSEQEVQLVDFSSEYASLVDDEEDMAEIIQLRKEGEIDE